MQFFNTRMAVFSKCSCYFHFTFPLRLVPHFPVSHFQRPPVDADHNRNILHWNAEFVNLQRLISYLKFTA